MMKHEFEALAGYEVSMDDYNNIIEPMYMATNLSKQEFVKTIDKKRFALKPLNKIVKEMKQIAAEAERICTHRPIYDEMNRLASLAEEYIMRKYAIGDNKTASFFIHEKTRWTCNYPVSIEIYGNKGYNTIEVINLV